MPILTAICLLLTIGYALLMAAYRIGWQRQPVFTLPPHFEPETFISIIIPARNEERNIGACLEAIAAQKYPAHLFEVIVIDDHSEDNTAAIVNAWGGNVRCVSLADYIGSKPVNSYKKAALAAGIAQSKGELIVTTDADCIAPNYWLMHLAAIYQREKPSLIIAPVIFTANHGTLQIFQLIDFMGMQGITAAAHRLRLGNMSNGANLAFTRAAYDQVNGYEGIDNIASGDDYLLTVKISKATNAIAYLKSPYAIVKTAPQPTWGAFLQQRIRWASKSGKYDDKRLTAILILVYLFNVTLLVAGIAGFFNNAYWLPALGMLAVKILSEYLLLLPVSAFFRKRWVGIYFPFLQPLHILYIAVAGFLGFTGNYTWKGRKVK
jgi:cellulose synthase/poly-beta-1,6-N-acetylglucosamine synthase-like glycosyltransferase